MADVLAVRDEYRTQNWAMVIQECSNSGLSNREFCRQRGISEKTYYYWLRKLRSQMAEVAGPQLVQLEPAPALAQDDVLQIQYRGAELKLPAGVDMDTVAALLRSLQSL
jgi:transposase-like protein